jgi:hypothetical protein
MRIRLRVVVSARTAEKASDFLSIFLGHTASLKRGILGRCHDVSIAE